ncbi:hypothetical protein IAU60_003772 [Kwoniella sp. DSM 27419]
MASSTEPHRAEQVLTPSDSEQNNVSPPTTSAPETTRTTTIKVSAKLDDVVTRISQSQEDLPTTRTSVWNWLLLLPLVTALPFYLSKLHYALPDPQPAYDAHGRPQPSEDVVLGHIGALENLGYRTVGTHEALAGEEYVLNEVYKLHMQCEEGGVLHCEWWYQKGSGFHTFDILDHEVLKAYSGIGNVIFKISANHPPSYNASAPTIEKDTVLLGSHIDSTMPAPGAADDGIGVGVMLDVARVLVERNEPFDGSVMFMWNETLQDGSHLYSTRHHTTDCIRAVINLEAAGTTGGALLFQATSQEMIEAYSRAPHPRGTVIAADVFSSGILMSDTDFVQFEKYLGVSGLDMALVGHSYFYHTRKLFVYYSMEKASQAYMTLAAMVAAVVAKNHLTPKRWKALAIALVGTPLGMVGGALSANLLAGCLVLSRKGQIWFRHEHLPLLVYAPAGYIGHFTVQLLLSKLLSPVDRSQLEKAHYSAQMVYTTVMMLVLQHFQIRSAYLFSFFTGLLLLGAMGNELGQLLGERVNGMKLKMTYIASLAGCVVLAVEGITNTLDIFTPLAGRMGTDAPAEFIVATISSTCLFTFLPPVIPLFHRVSRANQRKIILGLALFSAGVITALAGPWYWPYDDMHPKRVGVQYLYNHSSSEHSGHVAFMDGGPSSDILPAIHEKYGLPGSEIQPTKMTDWDSDWDVLYPISTFLETYKFPLDVSEKDKEFDWPGMGFWVDDVKWEYGIRHMRLRFDFRGLVWPTLAFEADVLRWSFPAPPPQRLMRHHIKVATSVDETVVDLNLTLAMNEGERLTMHWTAVDINQMVPGTASRMGPNMPASRWLLDMDKWTKERWDDSLDILMTGVVCGVIEV